MKIKILIKTHIPDWFLIIVVGLFFIINDFFFND